MTGLEKIIAEIGDEVAKEAAAAIEKAKAEADAVLQQAKEESDAKIAKISAAAASDVAEIERSRTSAVQLQRRQKALQTKQQVLAETLAKALQEVYALPDAQYFELLVKLAAGTAEGGEGEMLLNEKDKKRLPADFEKKLAAAMPQGAKLTVAKSTRPIDGGFVLKYGDVEENCSLQAIFDARSEEFSDTIRDILFA